MMLGRYKYVKHTCKLVSLLICLITTCSVPFPKRVRKPKSLKNLNIPKNKSSLSLK